MVFSRYSKLTVAMVLAAALVLGGCVGSKSPAVYAEVNGNDITREEFNFYLNLQRLHDSELEFGKEDYLDVLDFMIEERLLMAEARRRGIEIDTAKAKTDYETFRNQITAYYFDGSETRYLARLSELDLTEAGILQLIEEYQLINKLIEDERGKAAQPDDAAINLFYETEKDTLFTHDERRRVRHILINEKNFPDAGDDADFDALAQGLAQDLYERLLAGAEFAELAKEYSKDDGSAPYGGDIQYIEKADVVPEFGTASFAAEIGQVLEPIETTFGWHIIEVTEIQEPGYVELDADLYERIYVYLFNEDKEERIRNLIANLRAQADITKNIK